MAELPAQRFYLYYALRVWVPSVRFPIPHPAWTDERYAQAVAYRSVPCPLCGAVSGKRCTPLKAAPGGGKEMERHHLARKRLAATLFSTSPLPRFPAIPVALPGSGTPQNGKRADAQTLGGTLAEHRPSASPDTTKQTGQMESPKRRQNTNQ